MWAWDIVPMLFTVVCMYMLYSAVADSGGLVDKVLD